VFPVDYDVLRPVRAAFPRERRSDRLSVAVYRIEPLDTETRHPIPLTIDIGDGDFPFLIAGFHGVETTDASPSHVRWTTGEARLALPRLAAPESGALTLVVRFKADRPQILPRPIVAFAVDGLPVATIPDPSREMQEYRLALPPAIVARLLRGPTMLSITMDAFIPSSTGQNGDTRALGILMDWVRIQ